MGRKIHHLVSASDGKTITQLTHIYAETFEEASRAARQWRNETYPDLWILSVRVQSQGFQAGFTRLPGTLTVLPSRTSSAFVVSSIVVIYWLSHQYQAKQ